MLVPVLSPGMTPDLRSSVKDGRRKFALAAMLFLAALGGLSALLAQDASATEDVCRRSDVLLCEDWDWSSSSSFVAAASDWTAHGWILGETLPTYANNNVYCNTIGSNGSPCALRLNLPQDGAGTQYPDKPFPDQQTTIYARFYVKFSPNYVFNCYFPDGSGQEQKIFYLRSLSGGNMAYRHLVSVFGRDSACFSGQHVGEFLIDLNIHDTQLRYNKGDAPIVPDRWYAVELGVTQNTVGQANGRARLWVDGVLVSDYSGLDMRQGAGPASAAINDAWISAYYGGPTGTHPDQDVYYDNIVVATSPIGPISSSGPPQAPRNLRVR